MTLLKVEVQKITLMIQILLNKHNKISSRRYGEQEDFLCYTKTTKQKAQIREGSQQ